MSTQDDRKTEAQDDGGFLGRPGGINLLYRGLWVLCGVLAVADFLYHHHPVFKFEGFPVFYGLFGFVVCIGLVFAAKVWRGAVKRDEDYYDH